VFRSGASRSSSPAIPTKAKRVAAYRQAIDIKPGYAKAHLNLGNALKDQGSLDEAVAAYCQAIRIKPDLAEAHTIAQSPCGRIMPSRTLIEHYAGS
jgi:cytochrome c-type biogenesis protein CcmH/NrfG